MDENLINISFDVEPTGVPLTASILLDNVVVWQNLVDQPRTVNISFEDNSDEHLLVLRLADKQSSHTEINSEGKIVKDSTLKFGNFVFDDVSITQTLLEKSQYKHNFNGNGPETVDKFYGEMGCNGSVEIKFTSPFYLWLLENM